MCTSEAPASKASCVDSTCSAGTTGTAGLSFFFGTAPVMATVMMTGWLMVKYYAANGAPRTDLRGPAEDRRGHAHGVAFQRIPPEGRRHRGERAALQWRSGRSGRSGRRHGAFIA